MNADQNQDAGDPQMTLTVVGGGVPGEIDGRNVGNVQIAGDVNVFNNGYLNGTFDRSALTFRTLCGTTKGTFHLPKFRWVAVAASHGLPMIVVRRRT